MSFFFFQAEDGIRDIGVTGVQTCALPISAHRLPVGADGALRDGRLRRGDPPGPLPLAVQKGQTPTRPALRRPARRGRPARGDRKSVVQGKSVDLGGRRIIKKKIYVSGILD